MTFRRAKFEIRDCKLGPVEGFTRGQKWNGWACPMFKRDVADEIAKAMNGTYDPAKDAYLFPREGGEPEVFKGTVLYRLGPLVYPIGASCWTWDEVMPPGFQQYQFLQHLGLTVQARSLEEAQGIAERTPRQQWEHRSTECISWECTCVDGTCEACVANQARSK